MNNVALVEIGGSVEEWRFEGLHLGQLEREAHSLMWDIGDWWNYGERYGERAQIVTAADWTGPKHGNCRKCGSIAARFPSVMRVTQLTFEHHALVAPLVDDIALPALRWCAEKDPPRSTQELKGHLKQLRRATREVALAEKIEEASNTLGQKLYGVIYADPPWQFEPYSRETGMDRAADNHYPTMALDAICAMAVPAADDCVLFLWATVPMLPQALEVMASWGFAYRSHCVWLKDRLGTGFWFRNRHELLLVGTRGEVPAPAMGEQYGSVIEMAAGVHSAKPAAFAEMIEEMFPSLPALEMFARGPRLGWDVWGNEA